MWCWMCWRPRPTAPLMPRPASPSRSSPGWRRRRPSPQPHRHPRAYPRLQAQEIAKTVATLNPPKPEPAKPAPPQPEAVKPADAKPAAQQVAAAPQGPKVPVADGHRTRDGVLIHFRGAGMLPTAVFVRGLTAWVVVENAPNFDSHTLEGFAGRLRHRRGSHVQQRPGHPAHRPEGRPPRSAPAATAPSLISRSRPRWRRPKAPSPLPAARAIRAARR